MVALALTLALSLFIFTLALSLFIFFTLVVVSLHPPAPLLPPSPVASSRHAAFVL